MNDDFINHLNAKNSEMYLLYFHSLELQKLIIQEIPKNKTESKKYYLIPKEWFDNYKSNSDYSSIIKDINSIDYQDYETLEKELLQRINNDDLVFEIEGIKNMIEKESESIPKYEIKYPKNFIIVREEIFKNLENNFLYDIILGEKHVFILDSNKKNIFICTLNIDDNNEDISEFVINVNSIIILNDKKKFKEKRKFFNLISEGKGINNYYKQRNIDINKLGEQVFKNEENEEVGIFYQIINNNDENFETPGEFLEEYIDKIEPDDKKNNEKDIPKIKNAPEVKKSIQTEIMLKNTFGKKLKKSKCVTVYGDIYYYFKRHEYKNNSTISEYKII